MTVDDVRRWLEACIQFSDIPEWERKELLRPFRGKVLWGRSAVSGKLYLEVGNERFVIAVYSESEPPEGPPEPRCPPTA